MLRATFLKASPPTTLEGIERFWAPGRSRVDPVRGSGNIELRKAPNQLRRSAPGLK